MRRLLPRSILYALIFFTGLSLLVCDGCRAQCGYPATLHTNKDYCVGSSLIAESSHVLQKIVWYKNGQPVATITGSQSWDTAGVSLAFQPNLTGGSLISDIASDGVGTLYLYANNKVLRYTPGGAYGVPVAGAGSIPLHDPGSLALDQQGNLYTLLVAGIAYPDSTLVTEYFTGSPLLPGAGDSTAVISQYPEVMAAFGPAGSLFIDCQKNIYVYFSTHQVVVKWPAGSASGVQVAGSNSSNAQCSPYGGQGRVRVDNSGNIFYMVGQAVVRTPSPNGAVSVTASGCPGYNTARSVTDFWIDANDTVYLSGYDRNAGALYVDKWAPGASAGQTILSHAINLPADRVPITMDVKGNIFLGYDNTNTVLEFKRHATIDSAYTPTDTGAYYAVVTDIQGYTSVSDTFRINLPSGPPSIRISASATSTPVCTPITFTAHVTNPGNNPSYQWMVSGVPAGGDSAAYSYNLFANGDQVYCILHAQAGCEGPVSDTSNSITLNIDPHGAASVTISTASDTLCKGNSAQFIATVLNGAAQPTFEWLVNGNPLAGDDSAAFYTDTLSSGDVVTCLITSDDVCGLAKSNSIPVVVGTPAVITPNQVYDIQYGKSLNLAPVVSGTITSWLWSPGTGLSDSTIENPVADPAATTLYTLKVTSPGCGVDSGTILVNVYTPLGIPNAFTPNGDGHNDLFYVLGGPLDSRVEDFTVFGRWGQAVFREHDVAPGDPSAGWNGRINGQPAPTGAYIYQVVMRFADGSRQVYKGTVILIR